MQDEVIELLIHLFKSIKDTSFILENNEKIIKHQINYFARRKSRPMTVDFMLISF